MNPPTPQSTESASEGVARNWLDAHKPGCVLHLSPLVNDLVEDCSCGAYIPPGAKVGDWNPADTPIPSQSTEVRKLAERVLAAGWDAREVDDMHRDLAAAYIELDDAMGEQRAANFKLAEVLRGVIEQRDELLKQVAAQ